jgi:hypothetical protein
MVDPAARVGLLEPEVAERPACHQILPVLVPPFRLAAGVDDVPSLLAEMRLAVQVRQGRAETDTDEAQIGVLLPEPVGGQLGKIAQPAFGLPQRVGGL